MSDKLKQLNDDNLIDLLKAGKQEGLLTIEVSQASLDELIERYQNELHDLEMIVENVSLVYCHVTGGKISKCNTLASSVIPVVDDYQNDLVKEYFTDEFEPFKDLIEELLEKLKPVYESESSEHDDYFRCRGCHGLHYLEDCESEGCVTVKIRKLLEEKK